MTHRPIRIVLWVIAAYHLLLGVAAVLFQGLAVKLCTIQRFQIGYFYTVYALHG